uniref:Outer dense fiber of sperm tails 3-like 2a n=2 Tax=Lepisosteus oculatus TaxID=7918 RepID=W5MEW1_LEPOC
PTVPRGAPEAMGETEKRRPPIAGREKGPGPGRYALPPTIGFAGHDFTRPAGPAYSFHSRMSSVMYSVDSSPGPRYYIDAKLTRFGRDGSPAFSMLGRARGSGHSQTPGPGAYSPEKAPPLNRQCRPPSYTMGSRTRYRTVDAVPPPNRYTLPALLGSRVPTKPASASYTVSGRTRSRSHSEDLCGTPGPGRYNSTDPSVYLARRPAFSMLGRHDVPSDATRKPGPGTHDAEKVTAHKPRAPAFSLGIRHSEFVTPLVIDVSD